jgi:short-subunit dehydrogenase
MASLKDKVIVITGGSAGIGLALAKEASSRGARIVLAARTKDTLEQAAAQLATDREIVVADATRRADHEKLRDAALARFGQVDVWVNNAGRGISKTVEQLGDEDIDAMVRDNVKSVLYGMQTILPHFKQRGAGQIMNVSSMIGRVPFATIRSAYCASKAAMNMLGECLRTDLAKEFPNIIVTTFFPGPVATDFGLNALHGGVDNRALPFVQQADEVARVMADALLEKRADVYSRPEMPERVVGYLKGLAG